ncbi:hypothetical protein GGF50DRAFT_64647, partial [Schizophyllum commune]
CDSINFRDGTPKAATEQRSSASTAEKLRAGLTYLFGILCSLGTNKWRVDPVTGQPSGNPSISETVSRYMVSLKKRKAQAGETAMSARAITPAIMRRLYIHNRRNYNALDVRMLSQQAKTQKDDKAARMLQCAYTLANLCLLRFDEVLRIKMQDLAYYQEAPGSGYFLLTLPVRKNAQQGRVPPFPLWPLESDEAHMCPYRALCEWLDASQITDGYLFPPLTSDGADFRCTGAPGDKRMVQSSATFLEMFRCNLFRIGVDFSPYGTHSFRRGGCQYLVVDRRWNIRRVCEWGGWSTDFTHLTIVKYLISVADEPMSSRVDFFRPGQKVAKLCRTCGRSCPCNS